MIEVVEFNPADDDDLVLLYKKAVQAKDSGDLKKAVKISERGLKKAKKSNDKNMVVMFNVLHSEVYEAYLNKKIKFLIKRAEQEKNILRHISR